VGLVITTPAFVAKIGYGILFGFAVMMLGFILFVVGKRREEKKEDEDYIIISLTLLLPLPSIEIAPSHLDCRLCRLEFHIQEKLCNW
jgi:hypothetical protein